MPVREIVVKASGGFTVYGGQMLVPGDVHAYRIRLVTPWELAGCSFCVTAKRADGAVIEDLGTVAGKEASYLLTNNMYSVPGDATFRLTLLSEDGGVLTDRELVLPVAEAFVPPDATGDDRLPILTRLISDATVATADAKDAAAYANEQGAYAEVQAEAAREAAEQAAETNAAASQAEQERQAAEAARSQAELARQTAESARAAAEETRAQAETDRGAAETARAQKETERIAAEEARSQAEGDRIAAESARSEAETARIAAETTRAQNETERITAEAGRTAAETARAEAEAARIQKETERTTAEEARAQAETGRQTAELARSEAEAVRAAQETARQEAEAAREAAEAARQAAEEARALAERLRAAAETARNETFAAYIEAIDGALSEGPVQAVNGKTGLVWLTKADLGLPEEPVVVGPACTQTGVVLWFNTDGIPQPPGPDAPIDAHLILGEVTGETPIVAMVDGEQYGVENASADGLPDGRAYDFKILP